MAVLSPLRCARAIPDLTNSPLPHRFGCWCPDLAAGFVAQIQHFAGPVRDRIVGPGCQTMFTTIDGPSHAEPGLAHETSEIVIGQNVAPGRRRARARRKMDQVIATLSLKPAIAIVEKQFLWSFKERHRVIIQGWSRGEPGRRHTGFQRAVERLAKCLVVIRQDHMGGCLQPALQACAHLISRHKMDAAPHAQYALGLGVAQDRQDPLAQWLFIT